MNCIKIIILFFSLSIYSQNNIKPDEYKKAINTALNYDFISFNRDSLNVYYIGNSLGLTLDGIKGLRNNNNDKLKGLNLFTKEQFDNYLSQSKTKFDLKQSDIINKKIKLIYNYEKHFNEINLKERTNIISYEEARKMKYQYISITQPLFSLDKKSILQFFSYRTYAGVNVFILINNKWIYKATILEYIT